MSYEKDNPAFKTYKSFALLPTYTEVTILPQKTAFLTLLNLQVQLSQRDLTRKTKRKCLKSLVVSVNAKIKDNENISGSLSFSASPVIDLDDGLIKQAISPSGEYLAVLRVVENNKEKGKKKFVEIRRKGTLLHVLDVTDDHGDFYGDSQIGSLEWSRNESQIAYIAERKASEDISQKFDFIDDWGEQLSNKRHSAIVIVDIASSSSPQSNDGESGSGVVKVLPAFEGVVPGHLSVGIEHARSPRLNLTGDLLVFLSNKAGGPHWSCSELRSYDFKTGTHRIVVPIIHDPSKPHSSSSPSYPIEFPGLYIDQLPRRSSFISIENTEYLLVHSHWRSWKLVLAVNLLNGDVLDLSSSYAASETLNYKSYDLFAVWDKFIVMTESAPNQVDTLILGIVNGFNPITKDFDISWTPIDKPNDEEVAPILSNISWSVVTPYQDNLNLEMIHIKPITTTTTTTNDDNNNNNTSETNKQSKLPPLIVYPHGGPHTSVTTGLHLLVTTLVSIGFQIVEGWLFLCVGFGQNSIESLVGQIGELEVEEVQSTAKYLIDNNQADPNRVVIMGGSHGGFISAHLIGKYPASDFYRACVLRNPVLNIGGESNNHDDDKIKDNSVINNGILYLFITLGMASLTDIPDWCFAELSIPYTFAQPSLVLPSTYTQMFSHSPVKNIDRVKTPTLLTLGEQDHRVPHIDGLNWWYYLKGRSQNNGEKIDIRCKMYPETGHALDSVEAESDGAAEILRFLGEKLCV
ncbi:5984_t:CDS:10 [Ambispora gerdemannii]|uniref:acylaminoacyl-peptidase n=1 Tax=Ambispora gerdemannii TaxID=144530 RepID=A0A9N9F185_9GLOM|nr:5984_t:CDS:10 [Ambispora gerdemannii]